MPVQGRMHMSLRDMGMNDQGTSNFELAETLARLWPHREHESNAAKALCCRGGVHRWGQLNLTEVAPTLTELVANRQVQFCRWCSAVRIDGTVYIT